MLKERKRYNELHYVPLVIAFILFDIDVAKSITAEERKLLIYLINATYNHAERS